MLAFFRRYRDDGGKSHLIDVGVPHLAQEPEGRWGVWVINRELDESLHRTGNDWYEYN